jgi:tetratricopeptide (TPR) repeat protein
MTFAAETVALPAIKLCLLGSEAEFKRDLDQARRLFQSAWEVASTDFEKCIAAHYVGHVAELPAEALRWHQRALHHARQAPEAAVAPFWPSLYVNLGQAYEDMNRPVEAATFFKLAAELGLQHRPANPDE